MSKQSSRIAQLHTHIHHTAMVDDPLTILALQCKAWALSQPNHCPKSIIRDKKDILELDNLGRWGSDRYSDGVFSASLAFALRFRPKVI